MKHVSLLMLSLLVVAFFISPGALEAGKILPNPIYQHQLENGLSVVTVPFESPGVASFYLVVRVGSRNEIEKGVTGFAHFFEHMMFRGTDRYPKEKYTAVLKSTGASANANTSNDRTVYHMTGNAAKLDLMFELEADRFQNLNYPVPDFKVEAGAVKGEYTKNYASPYQRMYEGMRDVAFDNHTYKHTTMGFFADIVDMPNQYEYSIEFFNRYYRPEYTTIVVVGDVTQDRVNALAEKYFGDWERGEYISEVPGEPKQKGTRFYHLQDGSIPPFITMNYKGPAFNDKEIDMPALDVIATILFSQNSDLYKKLVVEEQRARFIGGGAFDSRDPFLFTVQASVVDKQDLQYVKDEVTKAIANIIDNGVDEKLLADTKSNLKYSFAMNIDNPDQVASTLCHYISLTGDPESINRVYEMYEKVSVDDIKTIAKKYFDPASLTIATISADTRGGVK